MSLFVFKRTKLPSSCRSAESTDELAVLLAQTVTPLVESKRTNSPVFVSSKYDLSPTLKSPPAAQTMGCLSVGIKREFIRIPIPYSFKRLKNPIAKSPFGETQ
ncbi:hypothetical protein HanRHA438_Chr05g0205251 [Helianthus annuus]|nr:hypothetical protein HanRHA438_Chr05g0205251 [Helianthus annuus]